MHLADIAVISILKHFLGDASAMFFILCVFVLLSATVRWNWRGALWTLNTVVGWVPYNGVWNVTGQPAASVPCGFAGGLPVALQIVGPPRNDALVLRAARAYEAAHPFKTLAAPL